MWDAGSYDTVPRLTIDPHLRTPGNNNPDVKGSLFLTDKPTYRSNSVSNLLPHILTFLLRRRPLVAIVIITAAKEEVRSSSIK